MLWSSAFAALQEAAGPPPEPVWQAEEGVDVEHSHSRHSARRCLHSCASRSALALLSY